MKLRKGWGTHDGGRMKIRIRVGHQPSESITKMGTATAKEMRFSPNATEFVAKYFSKDK
jgi:hypothetical protein